MTGTGIALGVEGDAERLAILGIEHCGHQSVVDRIYGSADAVTRTDPSFAADKSKHAPKSIAGASLTYSANGETQEMVFDAHDRAFAYFRGSCTRGIYDNMKTAVDTIFVGKDRAYNRRFLQMSSHYLVEPVACTPASGWKKGQVENQVGLVRERFFSPRVRVKSLDELNAWLMDKCVAYARAHRHPEQTDKTIWDAHSGASGRLFRQHPVSHSGVSGHLRIIAA